MENARMNTEISSPTSPSRRRFGAPAMALAIVAAAIVAGGGSWLLATRGRDGHDHAGAAAEAKEQWQCPMHPSIVQDHPGDCPICGMKLVKVEGVGSTGGDSGAPTPEGLSAVTIDPARQQLIGMKIAHAEVGQVGGSWRTSSRVAVDETRVHHVNVKFSGFMEKVYADFVGRPVKKGEPLFSIYSPELLAAQQEYLLALETRKRLTEAGGMGRDGDALVAAARRKLELWDVPHSEIDRLERTGQATRTISFYSPANGVLTKKDVVPGMRVNAGDMPFEIVDLSRVWALADAYETDLRHVKVGMTATLALKAFPNRSFEGRVAFIDPMLDPKTRTAKVRIEVPNPQGVLKPEMFGEVVLQGKSREGVRIPTDAVIHSGTKSVVFVSLPDGKFQPREVALGAGDADWVEVVSGLERGDGVVTRANFLVDSESRLRASLAALSSPGASAPTGGGQAGHEGSAPPAQAPAKSEAPAADPHAGHGR
jgi:Cu(I)/Ag(I) efflux system membrane fusion protein